MGDHHTWKQVLDIISGSRNPVVVVSATARTTRALLKAGREAASGKLEEALAISGSIKRRHRDIFEGFLAPEAEKQIAHLGFECINEQTNTLQTLLTQIFECREFSARNQDAVAATGEQISSYLLALCGQSVGINTVHADAAAYIKTNADFGRATPHFNQIKTNAAKLKAIVEEGKIPVLGGFYGQEPGGAITTLGFEGSDYTASLLGAALEAKSIDIWTDVSGIFTSDPRKIPEAKPIPELSFDQATEMAYFGAKVLHPSTLQPAKEYGIPVRVKNMFEPEHPGSLIFKKEFQSEKLIALSFKTDMNIITVKAFHSLMGFNFLKQVFEALEQQNLSVDVVNTTEATVSMALENTVRLNTLIDELKKIGHVEQKQQCGLISLIGSSFFTGDALITYVFSVLKNIDIEMISFSRNKKNLNIIVDERILVETARAVHNACF